MAVYCLLIGIGVAVVMFALYDPTQNRLRALASVSMDVICIIILFILIGSFAFNNYGSNRTTAWFGGLIVATLWALFTDFLNWAFDGSLQFGHMTFWFTVGSLCMGAIIGCVLSLYLASYMEETHNLTGMRKRANICAVVNLISFCITFVLALTGTAFSFVNGHYETGALYDVVTVLPILSVLYLTGYIIRSVKTVGLHDVFAVAGYIVFMVAGALIEAEYSIGTTYVAVTVADIFIFVMLQNEIIALEKRNVEEWMKRSNTDELTGLFNRHAYENDMAMLESGPLDDNLVYVSVDVNSLKNVNDASGHYAGDELIIGAAECLNRCFGSYGRLYRTGGDEFIAIINVDAERLDMLRKDIVELTSKWHGEQVRNLTISCGYASRAESDRITIRQMAVLADRRMYEAKEEYYRRTGIDRRRK